MNNMTFAVINGFLTIEIIFYWKLVERFASQIRLLNKIYSNSEYNISIPYTRLYFPLKYLLYYNIKLVWQN